MSWWSAATCARSTGTPNYTIKYDKETKDGNEADVTGTLLTTSRGKKVKIALEYKMIWKDRWVVYDVITDEQSMLENYRAEFNKIINKEGFDALLKRMKKKLERKRRGMTLARGARAALLAAAALLEVAVWAELERRHRFLSHRAHAGAPGWNVGWNDPGSPVRARGRSRRRPARRSR